MLPSLRGGQLPTLLAIGSFICCLVLVQAEHCESPWDPKCKEYFEKTQKDLLNTPLYTFASKLYLHSGERSDNHAFSPLSIQAALATILFGAKPGSKTQKELVKVLQFKDKDVVEYHKAFKELYDDFHAMSNSSDSTGPKVDFWTALLTRSPIRQKFETSVKRYYNGIVKQVKEDSIQDLLKQINLWGAQAGYHDDLVTKEELESKFKMLVLTSARAISNWHRKLKELYIDNDGILFHNEGKKPVKAGKSLISELGIVRLLEFREEGDKNEENIRAKVDELESLNCRAVELPLKGFISLTLIEPLKTGYNKLLHLEDELFDESSSKTKLNKLFDALDGSNRWVLRKLQFPAFKFHQRFDLIKAMNELGLHRIFDKLDSEITEESEEYIHVDKAIHKVAIDVNEKGIQVASIVETGHVASERNIAKLAKDIIIKHPFLFIVRYKSVPIIFGHLNKYENF